MEWFLSKQEDIIDQITAKKATKFTVSLILALGVTYYVRLDKRHRYRENVTKMFSKVDGFDFGNADEFTEIIDNCQNFFIRQLNLENNIARNDALKENVWMMAISIELKLPLFLIGKPGSSKSLAKTLIGDVMQGQHSYSNLFKTFKEIQMVSFQCSPLATADGILNLFDQCQKYQKGRDLSKFTAVVILDEVGLAEDSEKMPLKALHPLLEDGCLDDKDAGEHMKVSFVGISNWALDPAKMNRGILLSRGVPTEDDLIKTANGICSSDPDAKELLKEIIVEFTKGYIHIRRRQSKEYFGLRDFYSLIKMVFSIAKERKPTLRELQLAVQRNFGGYIEDFDPAEEFLNRINKPLDPETRVTSKSLITEAISKNNVETRYILLLTKNNVALRILQEHKLINSDYLIIFGSSFPRDQEYAQICHNINRIKIAMEIGKFVILCNLQNLYESLYDALNQNYIMLGGKRYVDLGLGTNRVKCRVHENFRMIIIAEDKEVHEKFPIPLINRLEKHVLGRETLLETREQKNKLNNLRNWVNDFCQIVDEEDDVQYRPEDVFIGYNEDVLASLVLLPDINEDAVKEQLLLCATPDAVSRLSQTRLSQEEQQRITTTYHMDQHHNCLSAFLQEIPTGSNLVQITTSSRLLTRAGMTEVANDLGLEPFKISLISLAQFETDEQFTKTVKGFFDDLKKRRREKLYFFIQAEVSVTNPDSINLIECSRYIVQDVMNSSNLDKELRELFCVVFLLHIPRVSGGCFNGLSVSPWISCHIDELRRTELMWDKVGDLQNRSLGEIFENRLIRMNRVITACLPKAASMIPAKSSSDAKRIQMRINTVMDIVERDEGGFAKALVDVIGAKLTDGIKAKTREEEDPDQWLVKMAMQSEHLREGNTFQKSIILYIMDAVTPILGDILTALDCDNALDLISSSSSATGGKRRPKWIEECYLDLFRRVDPRKSGEDCARYACGFPFSRFLSSIIDKWQTRERQQFIRHGQLQILCETSKDFAGLFASIKDGGDEALEAYLIDFIHLKYFNEAKRAEEMKENPVKNVIFDELRFAAKRESKLRQNNCDDSEVRSCAAPADIHVAHAKIGARVEFLIKLCQVMPNLAQHLRPRPDEFLSDISAFQLYMSLNEPIEKRIDFNDKNERTNWIKNIDDISIFYQRLKRLKIPPKTMEEYEFELDTCYKRFSVVKLYIDHLYKKAAPGEPKVIELIVNRITMLNHKLKKNALKNSKEFKKLVEFMQKANNDVGKEHFLNGQDKCVICREDLNNPFTLPCNHLGCVKCLNEHFTRDRADWKCPQCESAIPTNIRFESDPISAEKARLHQHFKRNLNSFFVDVLTKFVFDGVDPPDEGVVDTLMSFVVDERISQTKQISPFSGHCIDPTPVIRSNILQLLLHGDGFKTATKVLSGYLQQGAKFFQGDHLQLFLLVTYCLEDRLCADQRFITLAMKRVVTSDDAWRLMNDVQTEFKIADDPGDQLLSVARARIALMSVTAMLYRVLTATGDSSEGEEEEGFIQHISRVINKNELKNEMKKFIVSLLVKFYMKDVIHEWKSKRIHLDLMPEELIHADLERKQDNYNVIGGDYVRLKEELNAALINDDFAKLLNTLRSNEASLTNWTLAIHALNKAPGMRNRLDNLLAAINQGLPNFHAAANRIVKEECPLERRLNVTNGIRRAIVRLLRHYQTVLGENGRRLNAVTTSLRRIAENPASVAFYPTMPQDDTADVVRNMNVAVYKCKNCDYRYAIGECRQPMQQTNCPKCQKPIGGREHEFHDGKMAEKIEYDDQTKPGHILGNVA